MICYSIFVVGTARAEAKPMEREVAGPIEIIHHYSTNLQFA